jgi:hypothetical protein
MPRDRDAEKLRPDIYEIAFRTVGAVLGEDNFVTFNPTHLRDRILARA